MRLGLEKGISSVRRQNHGDGSFATMNGAVDRIRGMIRISMDIVWLGNGPFVGILLFCPHYPALT